MHWRWAVTLRPLARNSSVSSSGVFIAPHHITNCCFSTLIVDKPSTPPAQLWQASDVSDRDSAPQPTPPLFRRADALSRLASEEFDVLVIGGGITGGRGGPRCRQPGVEDRPGGEGRLCLGHFVQIVEDGSRRTPVPSAERISAGVRAVS